MVWNWFIDKQCNLPKIFILMLFKMVANQIKWSRLKQSSVIKVLIVEEWKPCEIYWRICDKYGERCLSQKMYSIGLTLNRIGQLPELTASAIEHKIDIICIQEHRYTHTEDIKYHDIGNEWTLATVSAWKTLSMPQ